MTKITPPHKRPSRAQVRYYFDHNSGAFFLYLSYCSRFSQKTSQAPQFDHILTTFLPISPEPLDRFCSSSNLACHIPSDVLKKRFIQIGLDLLELSLGRTDGH